MALELQGLETQYEQPTQLQGVEVDFQAPAQLLGLELFFDHLPYNPTGPLFDFSCSGSFVTDILSDDTGTGQEFDVLDVLGGFGDSGHGEETLTRTGSGDLDRSGTDSGQGLETLILTATELLTGGTGPLRLDAGAGLDAAVVGLVVPEAATATDSVTGVIITATETAASLEAITLTASETLDRPASDTARGIDTTPPPDNESVAQDSGSGQEFLFAPAWVFESASGEELGTTTARPTGSDTGRGVDLLDLTASETLDRPASDTGLGVEATATTAAITAVDAGVDPPTEEAVVLLETSDSASHQDQSVSDAAFTSPDTASGLEVATTTATLTFSDSASGSDVGIPGPVSTDSGAGSDVGDQADTQCPNLGEFLVGPEIRLPQWMSAVTSVDSKLYRLLQFVPLEGFDLDNQIRRAFLRRWLTLAEVGETRAEWSTSFTYRGNEELKITATASSNSVVVRRAISRYDYDKANDPVWWGDPISKRITLKNLMVSDIALADMSGVYTIGEDLVPDFGIFWRRGNQQKWRWLNPEEPTVSGSAFTLSSTGTKCFRFASQALLDSFDSGRIVVEWKTGNSVSLPLTRKEPDNIFDGYGSVLGIERLEDEDNTAYKSRMLSTVIAPPDATQSGVVRGIAARLGNLNSTRWNGVSTLTLDASGTQRITDLKIPGVPRFREITEQISSVSGAIFYSTYGGWRPGHLVLIDGLPQSNVVIAGNKITFPAPVTGTVVAIYSVEQYSTTSDASGYIRTLVPGTGLASGSHTVLYSQAVRVHSVDLEEFQKTTLLTPEGLPNRLFIELTNQLNADSQTIFGRARWGTHATWLEQSDDKPSSARLVIPFDSHDT